mmetsp:Transcript_42878/g.103604  ORF Transcript_42878/g.103604 Transcript_42878/m.103604 type:complete len:914 (+) Transcript_42878:183-2924(+)
MAANNTTMTKETTKMTPEQETLFLNMQLRKMDRALTGTVKRDKSGELWAVFILLVIIYGVSGYFSSDINQVMISLTLGECIAIGAWFFAVLIITSILSSSKFIELLYWMCVYLPLLAIVMHFVLSNTIPDSNDVVVNNIVIILLVISEVVAVAVFFGVYHFYPKVLNSNWVRDQPGRVQWLWDVKVIGSSDDWTFNYRRRKAWLVPQRYVCKYEGQLSATTGLPDKLGKWIDDSQQDGEVLTGFWSDAVPIAPFVSRQYQSGDMMKCVRVAYVSGSDDDFDATQFWPSNSTKGIRCGIAMTECCVSGKFYNNLPHAQNLSGYRPFDLKSLSMEHLLSEVAPPVGDSGNEDTEGIQRPLMITSSVDGTTAAGRGKGDDVVQIISSPSHGGVTVTGHVHVGTGKTYDSSVNEIVIQVERVDQNHQDRYGTFTEEEGGESPDSTTTRPAPRMVRPSGFLPRPSSDRSGFFSEEKSGDLSNQTTTADDNKKEKAVPKVSVVKEEEEEAAADGDKSVDAAVEGPIASSKTTVEESSQDAATTQYRLVVKDWFPTKHREVLVFFPGFNCSLEGACQSFGQLLSMTKLDERKIHPILYSWPCGQVLSYHSASRQSQNEKNHENFVVFLQGLRRAGVTGVHLMSHSMGVQTLIGSLCDLPDGSRSASSKCFELATDAADSATSEDITSSGQKIKEENPDDEGEEDLDDIELEPPLLICKTLTMLNPDFPLDSFVNHAFASARRICDTMTIVGDKTDQALFYSQTVNGVAIKWFDYEQPRELQPNERNKERLCQQPVIGRTIDELYFPVRENRGKFAVHYDKVKDIPKHLLFCGNNDSYKKMEGTTDTDARLLWLDIDVIDCTGLDTNIAGIRHSAYNLNPILLKDLSEILLTGQRAMNRSSTLYRDGNIFSYCHAPSYVAY